MTTSSSAADLDQVISVLQGDVTSIPVDAALTIIDGFEQQVIHLSDAGGIASGLAQLKHLLHSGNATQVELGQVLAELGSQTKAVASRSNTDVSDKLMTLGELLLQRGQLLV